MQKKFIVRLSDQGRQLLAQVVRKFKDSSPKVCQTQILLKAAQGRRRRIWRDQQIGDTFGCRRQTVETSGGTSANAASI